MISKRIVLIGYPAVYFLPFAKRLEADGFTVYWICGLTSDARYLHTHGFGTDRVLDVNAGFHASSRSNLEQRTKLAEIESAEGPLINDLIMMDRILSKKTGEFAYGYLAHLQTVIEPFLSKNRIELATSWRDTALQLLGMLICRKQGVPWVVPTRIRIPQEMYGFCSMHHTQSFIRLRDVTAADREWAASFLKEFRERKHQPALKKAARGYLDVIHMVPAHIKAFWFECKRAPADRGNDYARYSILRLLGMYIRRRVNLLFYKLLPPYAAIGQGPYCLYALHTQPESSIDVAGSFFSNQVALIRLIARSLPANYELYVKVHPTDVDGQTLAFYRRISKIPGVRLLDFAHDSRALVAGSKVIFALTGTIAYEAALLRKPVIVFAHNFFNDLPDVHYCGTPELLPSVIQSVMKGAKEGGEVDIVETLAGLRSMCFNGEVSRTYGSSSSSLKETDLVTVCKAYHIVFNLLKPDRYNAL